MKLKRLLFFFISLSFVEKINMDEIMINRRKEEVGNVKLVQRGIQDREGKAEREGRRGGR